MKKSLISRISMIIGICLLVSFSLFIMISFVLSRNFYSDLKVSEVKKEITISINKINEYTRQMEKKAEELAVAGKLFYNLKQESPEYDFRTKVTDFLVDSYYSIPESIGGGIWYDGYVFDENEKFFGPYVYWEGGKVVPTWDLSAPDYNYLNQEWYTDPLPADWNRSKKREKDFYWSAPYVDEAGTEALMITVAAFVKNNADKIIGLTTVDWVLEDLLSFVKSLKVTENSHTFLVDKTSGLFLAFTLDENLTMKSAADVKWVKDLLDNGKEEISIRDFEIEKEKYYLSCRDTDSGMLFGILVPEKEIFAPVKNFTIIITILSLALAAVILLFTYITLVKFIKPISKIGHLLNDIAEGDGDLTQRLTIKTDDEIGRVAAHFNHFADKLNNIISTIRAFSDRLADSGEVLQTNMQSTAAAVNEIAANVNSSSKLFDNQEASVTETASAVEQISRAMESLNKMIEDQSSSVTESSASIEEMVANINNVNKVFSVLGDNYKQLVETSNEGKKKLNIVNTQVNEISVQSANLMETNHVISGIAAQTNLLSMNAAIEAAHAGDAGRGFAVVADEIRKLAENSASQSKEIAQKLNAVKTVIDSIVDSSQRAEETFDLIMDVVTNIDNLRYEVENSMSEQIEGSKQILQAISNINTITNSVRNGSLEMNNGVIQITQELEKFKRTNAEVFNSYREITNGTNDINSSINDVKHVADNTNEFIAHIKDELSRFKLKENPKGKSPDDAAAE